MERFRRASIAAAGSSNRSAFALPGTAVLLVQGEGTNGSTTITDSSTFARTPSAVNGNAQVSTAQFQFGSASLLFDGAGDNIVYASSSDFNFAKSSSWSMAGWVRPAALNQNYAFMSRYQSNSNSVGWLVGMDGTTGKLRLTVYQTADGTSSQTLNSSAAVSSANAWHHVFFGGDGANLYVGLDGTITSAAQTLSAYANPAASLRLGCIIGGGGSPAFDYNGYMDSWMFRTGVCLHTANYTPPAAPYVA